MDPDAGNPAHLPMSTQPTDEIIDAVSDDEPRDRLGVVIAILLAVVAVTAAFAAWRTSVVSSEVSDLNRTALIDVSKQQVMRQIDTDSAYKEASYAVDAAMLKAYGESLKASGIPSLTTLGTTITETAVPAMEPVAGPFMAGTHLTPEGTLDVESRIDELSQQNAGYVALNPQAEFDEADRLAGEKTWLTVLSVLFAIALFWLGLAEITAGRWRWVNLGIGVAIFVLSIAFFGAVELFYLAGGGAA